MLVSSVVDRFKRRYPSSALWLCNIIFYYTVTKLQGSRTGNEEVADMLVDISSGPVISAVPFITSQTSTKRITHIRVLFFFQSKDSSS